MIPLKVRTEFSFRNSAGKFKDVFERLKEHKAIAITDRNSTFGHFKWQKLCETNGVKQILGVELGVVSEPDEKRREKSKAIENYMTFLPVNAKGLKEIYELVGLATTHFYYVPRLPAEALETISDNVIVLSGNNPHWDLIKNIKNFYVELNPSVNMRVYNRAKILDCEFVATFENNYINEEDHGFYEMICGRGAERKTYPQHILGEDEWFHACPQFPIEEREVAIDNTYKIADMINARIPQAENVKPIVDGTLHDWCVKGAEIKGVDLEDPVYKERFEYEMNMIKEKNFEDYFLLVGDLISWSKKNMAIGPARGSSAGSLVCYLCDITEIDPIPYNLLFERFMAPDRFDMPDIDTDFEDERRELAFRYLEDKYGEDCVARIGTVSFFKPKSALTDTAKLLGIPLTAVNDTKDSIIERSSADARASLCLRDTLEGMESGKQLLEKYPSIAVACEMEGHARHHGQHAAGILVTEKPITNYCAIDMQTGAVMLDKYDVEELGMLKIDALGLRTLTIIRETLESKGLTMSWLLEHGTDDAEAIDLLNQKKFTGIFQWEGMALQSITSQTTMKEFNDLVSITALSRPGPLQSGGTTDWIKRKNGDDPVEYKHNMLESITDDTLGVVVYQEQILRACNEIGLMSWEETTALRKAMSKSLGEEFFSKFEEKFVEGAMKNNTTEESARELFKAFCTFGSWSFNKSHAVSYGLVSYWTCVIKKHFPLEFFAATLRHAKDEDQSIKILRELEGEGYEHSVFDKELSDINWSVKKGKIYGGLLNIKGIGMKMAHDIINRRKEGKALTKRQTNLISAPITPFDNLYETQTLWGHVLDNPRDYNIVSPITKIEDIDSNSNGTFLILAKIVVKNPRDANELGNIKKRGYEVTGPTAFLSLTLEDDTGQMRGQINRFKYKQFGDKIVQQDKNGEYYLFKGKVGNGFVFLHIERVVKLTGNRNYAPIEH
jgi:DNA-directed DNA polymerase III PolC